MQIFPKDPQDRKYLILGLKIVSDFGFTIAIPVISLVVIAQWVEEYVGYEPHPTIIAFITAALLTAKIIMHKAEKYNKAYQDINKMTVEEYEKKEEKNDNN
jgi:thioredoxin-like negative regulator of GroEL